MILNGRISENSGRQALSTCLDCEPPRSLPKLSSLLHLLHPLPQCGSLCLHGGPSLDLSRLYHDMSWQKPRGYAQRWSRVLCLFPRTTPMIWLHGVNDGATYAVSSGAHCAQPQSLTELINPQVWKDAFSVTDSSVPSADMTLAAVGHLRLLLASVKTSCIVSSCGDIIPHHSWKWQDQTLLHLWMAGGWAGGSLFLYPKKCSLIPAFHFLFLNCVLLSERTTFYSPNNPVSSLKTFCKSKLVTLVTLTSFRPLCPCAHSWLRMSGPLRWNPGITVV